MKDKLKKHIEDFGALYLTGGALAAIASIYYASTKTRNASYQNYLDTGDANYASFLETNAAAIEANQADFHRMADAEILRIESKTHKSH